MTNNELPHTKEEWDRYKAKLEAENLDFLLKGFIIAMAVVLVIVVVWFWWMMWISTGGSY